MCQRDCGSIQNKDCIIETTKGFSYISKTMNRKSSMKLIFTGTGGLSTISNFNTSIVLQKKESNFLIDCGIDSKRSLHASGFSPDDIDAVYISHVHSDHCGGLEWLGINNLFNPESKRPFLVANDLVIQQLKKSLVGLKCIKYADTDLFGFFDLTEVSLNNSFYWNSIDFVMHRFDHVVGFNNMIPSFGLTIMDEELKNSSGKPFTILFTSDSLLPKDLSLYYQADLIIQDCETSELHTEVHSHYNDLKTLSTSIKRKMVLVHYGDNVQVNNTEWNAKAEQDGFRKLSTGGYGFVPCGYVMLEDEIVNGEG